jgi:hypothetical protein
MFHIRMPGAAAGVSRAYASSRSLESRLRAVTLIFVPHTAFTQIPAAAADNLFHGRHRYIVREGWKIEGKESEE